MFEAAFQLGDLEIVWAHLWIGGIVFLSAIGRPAIAHLNWQFRHWRLHRAELQGDWSKVEELRWLHDEQPPTTDFNRLPVALLLAGASIVIFAATDWANDRGRLVGLLASALPFIAVWAWTYWREANMTPEELAAHEEKKALDDWHFPSEAKDALIVAVALLAFLAIGFFIYSELS